MQSPSRGRVGAVSAVEVDLDALGLGDQVADRLGELGGLQRQAADVVVADGVDQVARPQQHRELAEVHLGDQHLVVARQDRRRGRAGTG